MKSKKELLQLVENWLEENNWDRKELEKALRFVGFCAECGPGTVALEGDALIWQYTDGSVRVLDFHSPDRLVCVKDESHEIAIWEDLFDAEEVTPEIVIDRLSDTTRD